MRIPSQFNEDNLYRRGRRGNESAHTYRRLIRLVIGLVLVIVVMRQASRPAIYQTFFGPQASSVAVSDHHSAADPAALPGRAGDSVAASMDPESRRVAHELTQGLQPSDQRLWVVALSRWESARPVEAIPPTAPALLQRLASLEDLSDQSRQSWDAMFAALMKAAANDPPSAPARTDRPRIAAFLAALDEAAAARVVDGSVWRSGDFDAFYRYLDQADSLSGAGAAATGVLPLLQQPDVFRNQLLRFHGGVARAQRIEASENLYGITEYWQLWLRPSDGADRPMVAIVPSVPTLVADVGDAAIIEEGPQVTVVGRFLKRLAYESSVGADLAPVLIGRISSAPVPEHEIVANAAVDRSVAAPSRLWLTVAAASLVGFALAALTMWRTSVMAKRARQLRASHRPKPDQFLRGMREFTGNEPDHDAAEKEAL